jgi:hypothetical protein
MYEPSIRKSCQLVSVIRAKARRTVKELQSERGSVESALVLIPLLILFLLVMQLGVVINFRNIDRTFAQSEASERAISGQFISSDEVIKINSFGVFDSLSILVSRKTSHIPILLPFIGSFINRGHLTDVTGLAVVEALS